ncbi:hypothetical protein ACLKA7_010567 [Drosophila subpalustris]
MDLMLQLSEQVQKQWSNVQQEEGGGGGGGGVPFRSVYTINGNPILPPLMTPERRLEMQQLREAAMAIEKQQTNYKNHRRWLNSDCCQLVDASTSTDLQLPQQPLIVAGRLKQQLQFSETLIYDNNRNAIIKFVKRDQIKLMQLLLEDLPEMRAQFAVIKENAPKFAMASISSLKEERKLENQIEAESQIKNMEKTAETSPKVPTIGKDRALNDLIGVARKLKENIINTERELRRSSTSPYLLSAEKESTLKDTNSSYCHTNRRERLHPQLWKRYHSYPFGTHCKPSDCAAPISPTSMDIHIPMVAPPPTPLNTPINKIQVRNRMALDDQQTPVESKLKSKLLTGSQQKLVANKSSTTSKKTPRASSSVSYAAHATSHAKVEGGSSEGNTRISSTQRRLSYDPRATLRRATSLKKAATVSTVNTVNTTNSSPATAAQPVSSPGGNTELIKRKMLEEMEQQQRHRFHQLVSQQADEQQRLQDEFQSQQQLLMDQMLADMSTYTFDKFDGPDHPESDSSSITSLPQSRLGSDINDDQKPSM